MEDLKERLRCVSIPDTGQGLHSARESVLCSPAPLSSGLASVGKDHGFQLVGPPCQWLHGGWTDLYTLLPVLAGRPVGPCRSLVGWLPVEPPEGASSGSHESEADSRIVKHLAEGLDGATVPDSPQEVDRPLAHVFVPSLIVRHSDERPHGRSTDRLQRLGGRTKRVTIHLFVLQ